MARKTAADFPQGLLDLFDGYVHGEMDRRAFLTQAERYAVAGVSAAGLLEMLRPNYALAAEVAADDPRIVVADAIVDSPEGNGRIAGYLVRPKGVAQAPAVIVVHENRGLNPYIKDVARRVAVAGYMAFAPDALTSLGGYPGDDEKGLALFNQLDRGKMSADFVAAARWLRARPDGTGRLGAVGFCFGGMVVNQLAVALGPDLSAGVPYYGGQPSAAEAARIRAPINAQYAGLDTRITEGWPAYDAALSAAGVAHEAHIYPGANHGFHNDTTPRYDEAAAKAAWGQTLGWFERYLRG